MHSRCFVSHTATYACMQSCMFGGQYAMHIFINVYECVYISEKRIYACMFIYACNVHIHVHQKNIQHTFQEKCIRASLSHTRTHAPENIAARAVSVIVSLLCVSDEPAVSVRRQDRSALHRHESSVFPPLSVCVCVCVCVLCVLLKFVQKLFFFRHLCFMSS